MQPFSDAALAYANLVAFNLTGLEANLYCRTATIYYTIVKSDVI